MYPLHKRLIYPLSVASTRLLQTSGFREDSVIHILHKNMLRLCDILSHSLSIFLWRMCITP